MDSSLSGRMRQVWREARANNARPPSAVQQARGLRLDPASWSGALVLMCGATAVLWIVQLANALDGYGLNRFGMRPRDVDGLWGIVTEPFLHTSYATMLSDTAPVLVVGWVLMLSGPRVWLTVTPIVIVLGGALTWLAAPSGLIAGSSSLVFGWLGYLIARAYFARRVRWIVTAVAVLFFFGTFLGNLLPSFHANVSWQAHLCGFGAGIAAGAALHPRRRRTTARGGASAPVS